MGLNTTASEAPDTEPNDRIIDAFGGYPQFRGKLYSDAVYRLTGESLYQEWIPPETVASMFESLERAAKCQPSTFDGREDCFVANELLEFFKTCKELRLGLIGDF